MPFAIAFGVPPVCAWQSSSRIPDFVDEYDVASQMLNAPIEMVKCETNDLMVPATSEIVIEGTVSLSETLMEGPYGEHAGYHFDNKVLPKPRQDITCVTFRNNAIHADRRPRRDAQQHDDQHRCLQQCRRGARAQDRRAFRSSTVWRPSSPARQLVRASGEERLARAHRLEPGRVHEQARQIHLLESPIGGCFTKILVVGEDIDPEDPLAVTYAFATRNHPEKGVWYFADYTNVWPWDGGLPHLGRLLRSG